MIKKTLYFGNPAYLSYRNKQMVVTLPESNCDSSNIEKQPPKRKEVTIPIEDMGMVVIDHPRITITQCLLSALLKNSTAVLSCDDTHMPMGMHLPFYGHTLHNERFRDQLESSKPLRKQLWQQTVIAKIDNQAEVLRRNYNIETGNMQAWSADVRSGDPHNYEAIAAEFYWKNILPEYDDFIRSRERSFPNNLFNYGYAILRGIIARALVMSGLLPVMGIHHHNKYNAYCLADDIMEPYRPVVDNYILDIISRHGRIEQLDARIKTELLSIPTLYVMIDGKKNPVMTAAGITTASLARCFSGEIRKISYPELP